jgi:hypothetical protein
MLSAPTNDAGVPQTEPLYHESDIIGIKRSVYRNRRLHALFCAALYALFLLTALFLFLAFVNFNLSNSVEAFLALIMLCFAAVMPIAVIVWSLNQIYKSRLHLCISSLSGSGQVAAIGVLLEAREMRDRAVRALAEEGLIKLLPLMEEGEAVLLTWRQAYLLCHALCDNEPAIVLAALAALTKIGGSEDLWDVRALLGHTGGYFPPLASNAEVRAAATICCGAIQARMKSDQFRTTLLRPVMDSNGAELLRPAHLAATEPELLLRTVNSDAC